MIVVMGRPVTPEAIANAKAAKKRWDAAHPDVIAVSKRKWAAANPEATSAATRRKSERLGMNFSTACQRLRKQLLFRLAQETGRDRCIRCHQSILDADDMSIDHEVAWLSGEGDELFWDLDNVGFSHRRCNVKGAEHGPLAETE